MISNDRILDLDWFESDKKTDSNIVTLLSGKGGVGKSILAYNLGAVAASLGYRTLIIDADWNCGNIHILSNAVPHYNLADIVKETIPTSNAIIRLTANLDMIASPAEVGISTKLNTRQIKSFFAALKNIFVDYDYIFIDTGSADFETINTVSKTADFNLMIINPELTSIADGYGLFKYLVKSNPDIFTGLLVNRAESESDYHFVYQKFAVLAQKFLNKVPFNAGFLLNDRMIIESVTAQKAMVDFKGDLNSVSMLTKLFKNLTFDTIPKDKASTNRMQSSINSVKELADIKE
ncbi:MAG: AAA family ATPase [Candidatus Zixiibacteriota bacterium]